MTSIKELRITDNFDFLMSDEDYMFYIHDVQKPQELILGADRGLAHSTFADPNDPEVGEEEVLRKYANGAIGPSSPYGFNASPYTMSHPLYFSTFPQIYPKARYWVGGGGRQPLGGMLERLRWDCMGINGVSPS